MQQTELFDIDAKNPCIGVCQSGKRGYCKGCLRSREERFYWDNLSQGQKIKVLTLCEMRKKKLNNKKMKQKEAELLAEINASAPEQLSFFE
ncbi:DUF1289 domain-containing protein [Catenovulum sp. SM1970]|uniref:DUF1289 domain-containing protein n=1 Tax=Marinifaba aquimaris TaxID=2741323 RepID=UPI001573C255|nr:DUF1289 domain-containing protein [Marinifaba aquimaris]NTS77820.1 DUF1289 domain-containing protein [Marinifaba aquimaris]